MSDEQKSVIPESGGVLIKEVFSRKQVLEIHEQHISCMDCQNGILLQDSLFFDLDREDEEQKCPALVHTTVPALIRQLDQAMTALRGHCELWATPGYCTTCDLLRAYYGDEGGSTK